MTHLLLTDGSQTFRLGARYTRDNMTITGWYSYTKVGDVKSNSPATRITSGLTATYADKRQ